MHGLLLPEEAEAYMAELGKVKYVSCPSDLPPPVVGLVMTSCCLKLAIMTRSMMLQSHLLSRC